MRQLRRGEPVWSEMPGLISVNRLAIDESRMSRCSGFASALYTARVVWLYPTLTAPSAWNTTRCAAAGRASPAMPAIASATTHPPESLIKTRIATSLSGGPGSRHPDRVAGEHDDVHVGPLARRQ